MLTRLVRVRFRARGVPELCKGVLCGAHSAGGRSAVVRLYFFFLLVFFFSYLACG